MISKSLTIIALSMAAFTACNKPSPDSQPAANLSDDAIDQAQIPVKEDFEEQAKATITDENLDEQVAKLATQIENDK